MANFACKALHKTLEGFFSVLSGFCADFYTNHAKFNFSIKTLKKKKATFRQGSKMVDVQVKLRAKLKGELRKPQEIDPEAKWN